MVGGGFRYSFDRISDDRYAYVEAVVKLTQNGHHCFYNSFKVEIFIAKGA